MSELPVMRQQGHAIVTIEAFAGARDEPFLRVFVDDVPLYTGPATRDGRKLVLDALRRQFELEIDRLVGAWQEPLVPSVIQSYYATLTGDELVVLRDALNLEAFNGSNEHASARVALIDRMLGRVV